MPNNQSRAKFFKRNPRARAIAALDLATTQQQTITEGPVKIQPGQFKDKEVIIIGAGVGGLTTAFELLDQDSGANVTILEALNRTGGRCLSLRTGDVLVEDKDSQLFDSEPSKPQVVRFERPEGDSEPYLNAGPGRIPSSHKRLLNYLKRFSVDVEIYVMNSESNLVSMGEGPLKDLPVVYRRLDHNTRGWLAQMVYNSAEELLAKNKLCTDEKLLAKRTEQLKDLMIDFGELDNNGSYQPEAGEDGLENGKTRAGYTELPGVAAGVTAEPIDFDTILASEFWDQTRFYQPRDFLWQPTLFQPVGGMDQVQRAFAQQVAAKGGNIMLNSPVKKVEYCQQSEQFVVSVSQVGTDELLEYRADYLFCNAAMPFLKRMLGDSLQGDDSKGLEPKFQAALQDIYRAQFDPTSVPNRDDKDDDPAIGFYPRFLANTTKVGWQAERKLWQGSDPEVKLQKVNGKNLEINVIDDSEVGVVPIFGGISWSSHNITQIWYPSTAYHDKLGTLTGTYNFSQNAFECGKMDVADRLKLAKEGAAGFGVKFAEGLGKGVAIAWQNMPHIKGGWTQWHTVGDDKAAPKVFNTIAQGSKVRKQDGSFTDPCFFIIGDQISSLPGWQEGAIAAALNALTRMADPSVEIPYLRSLPDPRLMVEGV